MWKCTYVKKMWMGILGWWGLVGRIYIEDAESMWNSAKVFPDVRIRIVWFSVLAASLWTVWLERNNLISSGANFQRDKLLTLVQWRSLEWNLAAGLLISSKTSWWNVNPIGVILASFKCKWEEQGPLLFIVWHL